MQITEVPTVQTKHCGDQAPQAKPFKDRRTRRALLPKHRTSFLQAPGSARVRSGVRTGRTKHFQLWMADLSMKSALQKTSTADLADHDGVPPLAQSAFALAFMDGIKNVWDLTQANIERLLSIPQIGPKNLEAVEQYLLEHNVKPSWTARGN